MGIFLQYLYYNFLFSISLYFPNNSVVNVIKAVILRPTGGGEKFIK